MSDDSNCETFQSRVQRLRSLRAKLCDQTSEWSEAFEIRDYVMSELQDLHLHLSNKDTKATPDWCKEKIEQILHRMCALSIPSPNAGDDDA